MGEKVKEAPQKPKIQFASLTRCPVCGWRPPPQSAKEVKEAPDFSKTWIIMQTPLPGIWFFICPECHGIATNPNAADNLKLLVEAENRRIVTAADEDRIVLPKFDLRGR